MSTLRQRITSFLDDPVLPEALTESCSDCIYHDGDAHGINFHLRCKVPDALLCPKIQLALTELREMVVCRCGTKTTRAAAESNGWVIPAKCGEPGQCSLCKTTKGA
mgnify:FL=1